MLAIKNFGGVGIFPCALSIKRMSFHNMSRQYMTKEDYVRQYQERKWNQVTKAKMKRMAKTLGVKHKIKRKKCVVQ